MLEKPGTRKIPGNHSSGEVEKNRQVYRGESGKRRKGLDEMMGLERYQRETNVVRMLGAWLATQNSYQDAADELSYLV